jgi:hypothetical protein
MNIKFRIKLGIIYFIAILIVFCVPYGYHLDLGPGPDGIEAMIWEIYGIGDNVIIRFNPETRLYLEYCGYRVITLIFILFYYQTKMKKSPLLVMAVITELAPSIMSLWSFLHLNPQGENMSPIIIPFPLLLVFVILLLLKYPKEGFVSKIDQ